MFVLPMCDNTMGTCVISSITITTLPDLVIEGLEDFRLSVNTTGNFMNGLNVIVFPSPLDFTINDDIGKSLQSIKLQPKF